MTEEGFTGKSILIADDEAYVRVHLAKRLTGLGLEVLQAGTGEEVLDLAKRVPDLIVMDVKMPILDGLETARRLKSDPGTSLIPVVLLSAKASRDEVAEGIAAGADDYVAKPVTFGQILTTIRRNIR